MKNSKNELKVVINYFDKSALISTAEEAENFINTLAYRGNGHALKCNDHTKNLLQNLFDGNSLPAYGKPFQKYYSVATTGCGNTNINLYLALADTLEEHNKIVFEQKIAKDEQHERERQEYLREFAEIMNEPLRGWYVVTVTGLASKVRGNDGKVTKSVKTLAETRNDAYNNAINNLSENPPKNVNFWYSFESSQSALIEFIGIWTDEAEMEYR